MILAYTPSSASVSGPSGSAVITKADVHGNLDYWSQAGGSATWTRQSVARPGGPAGHGSGLTQRDHSACGA
jgi:hypothetical protein